MNMRFLSRGSRYVALVCNCHFSWSRTCRNATGTAVVADPSDGGVVDDRLVIDVRHVHFATDVHDGSIVIEAAPAPLATFKSGADVAKSVVHAAIETDVGSPIALMKEIGVILVTPVTRGPQNTHGRRLDPRAGHPVII